MNTTDKMCACIFPLIGGEKKDEDRLWIWSDVDSVTKANTQFIICIFFFLSSIDEINQSKCAEKFQITIKLDEFSLQFNYVCKDFPPPINAGNVMSLMIKIVWFSGM